MRYIYSNAEDIDIMEIETEGNKVTNVTQLVPSKSGNEAISAVDLQNSLSLYMRRPNATIEQALAAWVGGYSSIRREED